MRAILIDPFARTVTEVEYGGNIEEIYKYIDAGLFAVAEFNPEGDAVYVDDNGLLVDLSQQAFFEIEGYPQPLAGKGLVLGLDKRTGDTVSSTEDAEEIAERVRWLTLADLV